MTPRHSGFGAASLSGSGIPSDSHSWWPGPARWMYPPACLIAGSTTRVSRMRRAYCQPEFCLPECWMILRRCPLGVGTMGCTHKARRTHYRKGRQDSRGISGCNCLYSAGPQGCSWSTSNSRTEQLRMRTLPGTGFCRLHLTDRCCTLKSVSRCAGGLRSTTTLPAS